VSGITIEGHAVQKSTTDPLVIVSHAPGAAASGAQEMPVEVFDGRTDRWPMSTEQYRRKSIERVAAYGLQALFRL